MLREMPLAGLGVHSPCTQPSSLRAARPLWEPYDTMSTLQDWSQETCLSFSVLVLQYLATSLSFSAGIKQGDNCTILARLLEG